jgi:hypothetical protein
MISAIRGRAVAVRAGGASRRGWSSARWHPI